MHWSRWCWLLQCQWWREHCKLLLLLSFALTVLTGWCDISLHCSGNSQSFWSRWKNENYFMFGHIAQYASSMASYTQWWLPKTHQHSVTTTTSTPTTASTWKRSTIKVKLAKCSHIFPWRMLFVIGIQIVQKVNFVANGMKQCSNGTERTNEQMDGRMDAGAFIFTMSWYSQRTCHLLACNKFLLSLA